jgi:hypothetical protein
MRLSLVNKKKFAGFTYTMQNYSMDAHPAVYDLIRAVHFCIPSLELKNATLTSKQALALADTLSLNCPDYAIYLLDIAMRMGWLADVPSLYTRRVQAASDIAEKLKMPPARILHEMIAATMQRANAELNEEMPLAEAFFTKSFALTALHEPVYTEEIYNRLASVMRMSYGELMLTEFNDIMYEDEAFELMNIEMFNHALDKYFHTPFGHYLKLIRPLYYWPFSFEKNITELCETPLTDDLLLDAFFSPCPRYTLTDLGLAYMNLSPAPGNYTDVCTRLPFAMLSENFIEMITAASPDAFLGNTYVFKIHLASEPNMWVHMDVPENFTLFRLYQEFAHLMDMDCNNEYRFFHDEEENPFAEYGRAVHRIQPAGTPTANESAHKKKAHKTADTLLNELDLPYKRSLLLLMEHQFDAFSFFYNIHATNGTMKWKIRFLRAKPRGCADKCPAITRHSRMARNWLTGPMRPFT